MPFVLTVDQRRSRAGPDLVDDTIIDLTGLITEPILPFERTAGDEFQGVVGAASDALAAALRLVRDGRWSVGLGIGAFESGRSARASRGPAFVRAREAVDLAKRRPHHVAVHGPNANDDTSPAAQADALLTMLAAVVARRTDAGWQAIELVDSGRTLAEAADELDISRQAVGQRLAVALWREELDVRRVAEHLLTTADHPHADHPSEENE